MFKFLTKKFQEKSLDNKYTELLIESHKLSATNPSASAKKAEEARQVLEKLNKLN